MLTLNNFRCWDDKKIEFNQNGIILISGNSGKGKSTILNSILYAITGNLKNVFSFGKEKDKVDVILTIDDITIIRGKNPTRFQVKRLSDGKVYESNEAQSVINKIFGSEFKYTSYIDQDNQYSFVYLSPEGKMSFLRELLLKDEPIEKIKDNIKKKIETSKNEVIYEESKMNMSLSFLSSLVFKEKNEYKVKNKQISNENYKEILEIEKINLEKCKNNKNILMNKLKKYEENFIKYNSQFVIQSKINDIEDKKKLYNYEKIMNDLKIFSEYKVIFERNKEYNDNKKKYNEDKKLLDEYKIKLKEYNPEKYKKIKLIENIILIENNISELEKKIGEDKERYLKETKLKLDSDIKNIKIIIEYQNVYECPECKTCLKIKDGILIKYEKIEYDKSLNIIDLNNKQKKLLEINKEITLFEKNSEDYNKQFDLYENLIKDFELNCDFIELLEIYKKEERSLNILQSKIIDLENKTKFFVNKECCEMNLEFNYNEIIENIINLKNSIRIYDELLIDLSRYKLEIINISDPSELLKETKEKIIEYDEKIEKYTKIILDIEKWKRDFDTNQKYIELKDSIEQSKNAREYLIEEIKCCEKLSYYVKEAETKSIFDFIDSLNLHASIYLEDFFPDEDISVELVTNKELKSGKDKIGLFFEVNYKNIKGDIEFLSGGQRDRVNLAFTIALSELVDNRILLLDECISSLDNETSDIVIETLREKYKGKLIFCVAHQVNTGIFEQVINI